MFENTALQIEVKAEKAPNMLVRVAPTLAVVSVLGMSGAANAAAIEIPAMTEIITMITGMVAVVASVGMAVLSVYATARVFKWVKAAF